MEIFYDPIGFPPILTNVPFLRVIGPRPVSYTHLSRIKEYGAVGKDTDYPMLAAISIASIKPALVDHALHSGHALDTGKSVSYTHLDVYKRQFHTSPPSSINTVRFNKPLPSRRLDL